MAGLCIIQTDRRAGGRARPAPVTTPRSTLTKRPLLVRNNDGVEAGRDPETITVGEWLGTPHGKKNPYAVMREKCLDCCCGQVSEVRLCPAVDDCRPGRPGSAFAVRCMMGFWTRKEGELAEFRTTLMEADRPRQAVLCFIVLQVRSPMTLVVNHCNQSNLFPDNSAQVPCIHL